MKTLSRRIAGLALAVSMFGAAPGCSDDTDHTGHKHERSALTATEALPGAEIPKFVTPLPTFGPGPGSLPRVKGDDLVVRMKQIDQQLLPSGFGPSKVWAYQLEDRHGHVLGPAHSPAVSIEARRGHPTTVHWVNELPAADVNNPVLDPSAPGFSLQALLPSDQTLHWADPLHAECAMFPSAPGCERPYLGPPPAVVHLHGGEVPSAFDGGPDAWFTPGLAQTGPGFVTDTYVYPNTQEPGTLWFHDHALGLTRVNVYSGLAGFYLLRDPKNEPRDLPQGRFEVELAIQDRTFDRSGQIIFPGEGINAEHPHWQPEFFGDAVLVNGATWPFMKVEARRYRLRILNGSNARFYNLSFGGAPVYAIGADSNYLDKPVRIPGVLLAPGERADVLVDFAPVAGTQLVVTNDAREPFPDGDEPDPETVGQIMRFDVGKALEGRDPSCDPELASRHVHDDRCEHTHRDRCLRPHPTVRLADNGQLADGVSVNRVRRLTLNEVMGEGGPLEVLVNNSHFMDPETEQPRLGTTELWEIVNLTGDTHPIHTHLVQYQLLNREAFDADAYGELYAASFPGGYQPGGGPPLPYDPAENTTIRGRLVPVFGGNPDESRFLSGSPQLPAPEEAGWKETARAPPGTVTRFLVRLAPTDAPTHGPYCQIGKPSWTERCKPAPGTNLYAFDPANDDPHRFDFAGFPGGPGYVWHCHIVDHEDNDMMRPLVIRH